jgi:hypothetical protein
LEPALVVGRRVLPEASSVRESMFRERQHRINVKGSAERRP